MVVSGDLTGNINLNDGQVFIYSGENGENDQFNWGIYLYLLSIFEWNHKVTFYYLVWIKFSGLKSGLKKQFLRR